MQSEFFELGFDIYLYAKNRRSLADSFKTDNRCGIYILHFENGEYYVGQATDVVKRHAQHRVTHSDIIYVSFKQIDNLNLTKIEKSTIHDLEKLKKGLRNISWVSLITGDSDFDLIVTPDEQNQWTNYELGVESLQTERFDYPELRQKYNTKYTKLKQQENFELICQILQDFILFTIPFPRRTEYSFWSCSCLPSGSFKVFSRVNIFWQEVLTIHEEEFESDDKKLIKDLTISLHVCKSKLFKFYTEDQLKDKYNSMEFTDHCYEPGGQDQQNILVDSYDFFNFFDDNLVLDAIKEFNLRLMKKGGCIFNRYHCFDLADQALTIDNMDFEG